MDKQAKWIWKKDYSGWDIYCDFYDKFQYQGGKVTLQISADSNYALYINGQFAENSQYPDYPHYKVYDQLDITRFCREGENHMAIIVWYYGKPALTYYPGNAALRYALFCDETVLCRSGETTLCRESRDYQCGLKKLITSHLGYSFHYDCTLEDGWKEGALEGFEPAAIVEQELPMFIRPVKRMVWADPVKTQCILNENNTYLRYDLGREEVGYPTLKVRSTKKQKLVIAFGEHLLDGCIRKKINKYDFTVEVTVGEGETFYMNPFRRLALRYLEVFAEYPIEVDYVTVKPACYPVKKTGMAISDPLDKAIYDTCVRTLELCMHEHYEDGPWREQALYCLDSRNQMLCGYYCFQEYEFARANLKLMSQDRRYDGLLSLCFPAGNYRTATGLCIPSFSLHYFTQVWEYMSHSGDYAFGKEIYHKLLSIMEVFTSRIEDGCVKSFPGKDHWNYYEWREGLSGHLDQDDGEVFEAALNVLLILALRNMGRIARAIGEKDTFTSLIPELVTGIRARFMDKETGLFYNLEDHPSQSEFVNSICILADVVTPEEARNIAEKLVASDSGLTTVSLSTICFKYDALLKVDPEKYKDYILEQIRTKYKYMLDQDATAFWEYDPDTITPSGSRCHGWSALPIYYFEVLKTGNHTSSLY